MEKYVHKLENANFDEILWNIPEQKQGIFNIIGGNAQSFRTEVKTAEFLANQYPLKGVNLVLPSALEASLPKLENVIFLQSTDSGSFGDQKSLANVISGGDFSILLGDFSKNKITEKAVAGATEITEKPLLVTRDTVDLIAESDASGILMRDNIILLASMVQIQKLLRSIYYPRMILLSQPIMQVTETIHKFTLSYPVSLITLFNGMVIMAKNGEIGLFPLDKSNYTPITFWGGELAGKIAVLGFYNPGDFVKSVVMALK